MSFDQEDPLRFTYSSNLTKQSIDLQDELGGTSTCLELLPGLVPPRGTRCLATARSWSPRLLRYGKNPSLTGEFFRLRLEDAFLV